MPVYEAIDPDAYHMVREIWEGGCHLIGYKGAHVQIAVSAEDMKLIKRSHPANWSLSPVQDIVNLWSPVFDGIYYDGFFFGYFGSIIEADRDTGEMTGHNRSCGSIITNKWQWDRTNNRWYCNLRRDLPRIVPE